MSSSTSNGSRKVLSLAPWALGILLLTAQGAWAARAGKTELEEVKLYESPSDTSKVIKTLPKDTPLAASNVPVTGFHRVRTINNDVGWVVAEEIVLDPPPAAEETAAADTSERDAPSLDPAASRELQRKKKAQDAAVESDEFLVLKAVGGATFFNLSEPVVGLPISLGIHFGGELELILSKRIGLVVRGEQIVKSVSVTEATTSNIYQIALASTPMMAGFDWTPMRKSKTVLRFIILGGLAQTQLTSTNQTALAAGTVGSTSALVSNPLTLLGTLELDWKLSRHLFLSFEGGYRYLRSSPLTAPVGAGSGVLNSSFSIDLSGPIAGAGVGVVF